MQNKDKSLTICAICDRIGKTALIGQNGDQMSTFVDSIISNQTSQTIEELVKSLIDMEECGEINNEDVDECVYYLQKVADIAGIEVDYDELMDYET